MSSPNLEDVIRDLAARGELSHISLVPSASHGQQTWRASFTMCSRFGVSFAEDTDPVKAILLACTTAKMKPAPRVKPVQSLDLVAERLPETTTEDPLADLM